jgi:hypothetical protein
MIAQSYKGKVDMIVEREQILTKSEMDNQDWFPNYIIVRRPVDTDGAEDGSDGARIKEISIEVKNMADAIGDIKAEMRQSI